MVLAESKLRVGVIYGDPENSEYVLSLIHI